MISPKQIYVMSAVAGINVATIYYNQPILNTIAQDLHVSALAVGNLPTFSQIGYGLGLFFVSPLGDKMDRKKLLLLSHLCLALCLLGLSVVENLYVLYALSLLTGLFAVSAQIVIPMAAAMSGKDKGRVVGSIFSGLLTGILLARTLSGYVTEWFGNWHGIFALSAVLVVACMAGIAKTLPSIEPHFSQSYGSLLASCVYQLKRFSLLRANALLITVLFGVFCSFWTTLTFKLSLAPFNFNSDVIGLFGILAAVGALLAPYIGKVADKINPTFTKILAIAMIVVSIILMKMFEDSLAAFIIATLLLDIGFQAVQINNLAQIYTLDESAHSRINTAYMSSMFLGGALGTAIGVYCWEHGGWALVTVQLLVLSVIAFAIILFSALSSKHTKAL